MIPKNDTEHCGVVPYTFWLNIEPYANQFWSEQLILRGWTECGVNTDMVYLRINRGKMSWAGNIQMFCYLVFEFNKKYRNKKLIELCSFNFHTFLKMQKKMLSLIWMFRICHLYVTLLHMLSKKKDNQLFPNFSKKKNNTWARTNFFVFLMLWNSSKKKNCTVFVIHIKSDFHNIEYRQTHNLPYPSDACVSQRMSDRFRSSLSKRYLRKLVGKGNLYRTMKVKKLNAVYIYLMNPS